MSPTIFVFLLTWQIGILSMVIGEVFECNITQSRPVIPVPAAVKQEDETMTQHPPSNNICIFNNIYVDENMVVDFKAATASHHYAIRIETVAFVNSTVAMDVDELLDRLCGKFWNLFNVIVNGTHFNCHVTDGEQVLPQAQSPPQGPQSVSSEAMQHKVKIIHFDVGDGDPVHQKLDVVLWGIAIILILIVTITVGGAILFIVYRRQQRHSEFLWRSFRYGFR